LITGGSLETAGFIHWNVNPNMFSIGALYVKWYTVLFVLSFVFGYQIMRRIYRREGMPLEEVDKIVAYTALGTLIGTRLGHCLFYDPFFYLVNPMEILKIWKSGLSSHGGVIGIFLALYLYARKKNSPTFLWLADRVIIPVALAACLIRLGNLFNSEILGTASTLPWAIVFERYDNVPRHPTQVYESITNGLIFILLIFLYRKYHMKFRQGFLSGIFFIFVFTARFFIEFTKMRQASYGADMAISVGQWLSIPVIIAGVILLVRANIERST
jgi:prolipoprotein diacylglyceryl transferase